MRRSTWSFAIDAVAARPAGDPALRDRLREGEVDLIARFRRWCIRMTIHKDSRPRSPTGANPPSDKRLVFMNRNPPSLPGFFSLGHRRQDTGIWTQPCSRWQRNEPRWEQLGRHQQGKERQADDVERLLENMHAISSRARESRRLLVKPLSARQTTREWLRGAGAAEQAMHVRRRPIRPLITDRAVQVPAVECQESARAVPGDGPTR